MNRKFLTVSIPAYNDEQSLPKLVEETERLLQEKKIDFDILIINDGSQDNTATVARLLAEKYDNIRVVNHKQNLGFGPTLKKVFTLPESEWVIFLPGDNQFPASNIELFLNESDRMDYILGRRRIRKDTALRILYAGFYNLLVSRLSGYAVDDVNGIVCFKKRILDTISLNSKTSFIHAELFLESKRKGFAVKEIDIIHHEREFGRGSGGKWSVIVPTVLELFTYIAKKK